MKVNEDSLHRLDNHWAVSAIGEAERDRVLKMADTLLVRSAVGKQVKIDFVESHQGQKQLERLALAYEMAAIEGLNAFLGPNLDKESDWLRDQCASAAWRTFGLRRLLPIPDGTEERIFHILHLSCLAYCGDRWSDLRRWYSDNENQLLAPSIADVRWDRRLLYRLYDCWSCLFRKKSWDDLHRIHEIIAGLREDQKIYESGALNNGNHEMDQVMALRLIALYHWAKATELLALYILQGEPADIGTQLDKHFESAHEAAAMSRDSQMEMLTRWLHAASRRMAAGSVWWIASKVNSKVSQFISSVTKQRALFELLPPQRAALQEQGLLDQAYEAIVIEMPTSGGKTLLAQFKMLQALNQFKADSGWVAYVAPTRALTAQITRRLRRDFSPLDIKVEQLTGAVEIDSFEEDLLAGETGQKNFDILVATPEKLQLVIRNKKVTRPLALVVMDEAHNIGDDSRGLRIELLLATIKRDCRSANFLLLMPYVENAARLTRWLSPEAGRTISIGTTAWKPNERIVGIYHVEKDAEVRGGWKLKYETLITTPKTIHLEGCHQVGRTKPLGISYSKTGTLAIQTAAMARVLSERGTSIAVANRIKSTWTMARKITESLEAYSPVPPEIELVQGFLANEISPEFELRKMLEHGVTVHHAGLSDETRALIEWLAEENKLRVLCTTSTIAQGINFPVSSVFLASRFVPSRGRSIEMKPRDFWNLAGRAGRLQHDSVGVVGLAAGKDPEEIKQYVSQATGELISQLVKLLDELEQAGELNNLEEKINQEQWADFRCYVAHLWNEKQNLDAVLTETEQLLRNTYGYGVLRSTPGGNEKARALLEATKSYARKIAEHSENATLADATGFDPDGVRTILLGLNQLEKKLTVLDWMPESLFGTKTGDNLSKLFGIMLRVPQLKEQLEEIGGEGFTHKQIADISIAWISGKSIQEIAKKFFKGEPTNAITDACKAIYRNLVSSGPWGLAALSKMPTSGIDFDSLTEGEARRINILPSMLYHGVRTEEAVLMRMNALPRSIAEQMGSIFRNETSGQAKYQSVGQARNFLKELQPRDWEQVKPTASHLSGQQYKSIWELLSGEVR